MSKTTWAAKSKTSDAIIDAWNITAEYVDNADALLSHLYALENKTITPAVAASEIASRFANMCRLLPKALDAIWEVNEWLTRARIALAIGCRKKFIVIETDSHVYENWHTYCLNELAKVELQIIEQHGEHFSKWYDGGRAPLTERQIKTILPKLVEWKNNLHSKLIDDLRAGLGIEAYQAVAIWEQSPRTDADEVDSTKATPNTRRRGRPKKSNQDNEIARLEQSGMSRRAIGNRFNITESAVTKALNRAKMNGEKMATE